MESKKEKLLQRKRKIEAQLAALRAEERKRDTRKKIILGGTVLALIKKHRGADVQVNQLRNLIIKELETVTQKNNIALAQEIIADLQNIERITPP